MLLFCTILTACLSLACAIDWSAKELEPYEIASSNGIFEGKSYLYGDGDSASIVHLYLGVNQTLGDDIKGCTPGLDVCALFTNSQKPGLENDAPEAFGPEYDSVKYEARWNGVSITLKKRRMRIHITLRCFEGDDYLLGGSVWGRDVGFELYSKAGCLKESWKDKEPYKHSHEVHEHWGWFTWIFIFMVLFSSIYVVGGAWFQYSKGNAIDFKSALKEVVQNGVDLLRGMPSFISEILEKITRRSQSRGEYSAL